MVARFRRVRGLSRTVRRASGGRPVGDFAYSIELGLLEGRKLAELLMVDEVSIVRRTGEQTTDAEGSVVDVTEVVYAGRAKVQVVESIPTTGDVAGLDLAVTRARVDVPISAGPFEPDDVVTVTAARHDPHLAGVQIRVLAPFNKSMATAQRLPGEVVS